MATKEINQYSYRFREATTLTFHSDYKNYLSKIYHHLMQRSVWVEPFYSSPYTPLWLRQEQTYRTRFTMGCTPAASCLKRIASTSAQTISHTAALIGYVHLTLSHKQSSLRILSAKPLVKTLCNFLVRTEKAYIENQKEWRRFLWINTSFSHRFKYRCTTDFTHNTTYTNLYLLLTSQWCVK